ncbi:MAG TPA: hypothetical protein VFG04_23210 [Planctomycetaceae bacterium]|jgi:hypothetical protein|nr:hypothetical protein [Planctomycetaceae bacterium]
MSPSYSFRSLGRAVSLALVAVVACAAPAAAYVPADADEGSNPASGTWNWTINQGKTRMKLRLRQNGDQLTGAISADRGPENAIQHGRVDGNKIFFKVGTLMGKVKIVAVYEGTIDDNIITGGTKVYVGPNPQEPKRPIPWRARRANE